MVTLPNPVRDSISVTDAVRIEEPATQRDGIPTGNCCIKNQKATKYNQRYIGLKNQPNVFADVSTVIILNSHREFFYNKDL